MMNFNLKTYRTQDLVIQKSFQQPPFAQRSHCRFSALLSGHHGKSQRPAQRSLRNLWSLEHQRGCRQMEKSSASDEDLPKVAGWIWLVVSFWII
jgi:hypothetical protein